MLAGTRREKLLKVLQLQNQALIYLVSMDARVDEFVNRETAMLSRVDWGWVG